MAENASKELQSKVKDLEKKIEQAKDFST